MANTKTPAQKEKRASTLKTDSAKHANAGGFKREIVHRKKIKLDKKRAQQFLFMDEFEGERDVNPGWSQALRDLMAVGLYLPELGRIVTCRLGKKVFRLDGQHTCDARLSMPDNYNVEVEWIEYRVPNEESLRILYTLIDANKPRTSAHRVRAILTGALDGVWPSLIAKLTSGLKFHLFEKREDHSRCGPNEMANLISGEHKKLFTNVAKCYQQHYDEPHLKKMSVHAAMFATFQVAPRRAKEFWDAVATGEDLKATDAEYKLREFLTHVVISRSREAGQRKSKHFVTSEGIYRICIEAWNTWRADEEYDAGFRFAQKHVPAERPVAG